MPNNRISQVHVASSLLRKKQTKLTSTGPLLNCLLLTNFIRFSRLIELAILFSLTKHSVVPQVSHFFVQVGNKVIFINVGLCAPLLTVKSHGIAYS